MSNSEETDADWYDWINQHVLVEDLMFGKLKYFGNTEFGKGMWCGIELEKPLGKNDGMVNNVRYFTCEPMFGLFVPSHEVVKVKNNLKEQILECEHFNKTFTFNDEIKDFAAHNAMISIPNVENVDNKLDFCKLDSEKLSKSRSDSEESLGILNTDLMNELDTWDSPTFDSAPLVPLNHLIIEEEESPNFVLPPSNNKILDEFSCPIFASTPRHPNKKQIFKSMFECPSAFIKEVSEDDVFEEQFKHTSEIFFDVDKLKNTPNLSSTSKNLVNFDNFNIFENSKTFENNAKQDKVLMNKNLSFLNPCLDSCQNLDITYELSENFSPVIQNISVAKSLLAKNSFIKTGVTEEVGNPPNCSKYKNLPKSNLFLKGNELNATFELNSPDSELKVETANSIISNMNKTVNLSKANFSISPLEGSFTNTGRNKSVLKQTFILESSTSNSKNDIFEVSNDESKEIDSCVTKNLQSHELTTPQIVSSSAFSEKCDFLPSNDCNNSVTSQLLKSNVDLNGTFQKPNEFQLNDTFLSLKNKMDYTKRSNVENSKRKSNQGFKKPFSPISKFKHAPKFHNSKDIKNVKEEKPSTSCNFKFNKKRQSLNQSLSTDLTKPENSKDIKRLSLASSLETNLAKRNSIYSRRSSLSSDSTLKTNIDKREISKYMKRPPLSSNSSAISKKKVISKEVTARLNETKLETNITLKTNIDKTETSKCTKRVSLALNSIAVPKKKVISKLSETKLDSTFDKGSNILKIKDESSLEIPTKCNKKNQVIQNLQICPKVSVKLSNIIQKGTRLSAPFNRNKSNESKFGNKLRYSLRIPKSSNEKSEMDHSLQICSNARVSDTNVDSFVTNENNFNKASDITNKPDKSNESRFGTKLRYSLRIPKSSSKKSAVDQSLQICSNAPADSFVPNENNLNKASSITNKPEIKVNKPSQTNSELLNKTLILAEVFPPTDSSGLKKSIPVEEEIEKNNIASKNQNNLKITCEKVDGSDIAKGTSCGIQKLKISFANNVSSGIKIPQLNKNNCSSTCLPVGIIKPRFSMMHPYKDEKKLEIENIKPSQILPSFELKTTLNSRSVINCNPADKSISKPIGLSKKTVFSLKNKVCDEKLGSNPMKGRIDKDSEPLRIPKYVRSSTGSALRK